MSIFDENRNELRLDISRYIVKALKMHRGSNYKKKIPLIELVDSKIANYDTKFVIYVGMAETIKESLEKYYPYLNLEGFDLQWTADELIVECVRQHNIFVSKVPSVEKSKIILPERIQNA
ncbi:hypothetical protein D3C76_191410 [compost metagenome]